MMMIEGSVPFHNGDNIPVIRKFVNQGIRESVNQVIGIRKNLPVRREHSGSGC
jgi:hypothetical protein